MLRWHRESSCKTLLKIWCWPRCAPSFRGKNEKVLSVWEKGHYVDSASPLVSGNIHTEDHRIGPGLPYCSVFHGHSQLDQVGTTWAKRTNRFISWVFGLRPKGLSVSTSNLWPKEVSGTSMYHTEWENLFASEDTKEETRKAQTETEDINTEKSGYFLAPSCHSSALEFHETVLCIYDKLSFCANRPTAYGTVPISNCDMTSFLWWLPGNII